MKSNTGTIVVSPDCSRQCRSAAELLQDYIEQSTGVRFPIWTHTPPSELALYVGRGPFVDSLDLGLEKLAGDGFVLKLIDDLGYVIVGPTDRGTEFGVCEFLERVLGVRWLMPGPDGTDVPKHDRLTLPRGTIRQEPAYWSRRMMGLAGEAQETWAQRLRQHSGVEFHHHLHEVFRPDQYAKSHPHFFPQIDGKRYVPTGPDDYDWQLDFMAPGLADEAIRIIKQYFRDNPREMSFSLGIPDSSRFDDRQKASASYYYYRWCNWVVQAVVEEFPDKWFGLLAYREVSEPPRFKLHPRIIPYLCEDRMKWIDRKLEQEGSAWVERWTDCAAQIGHYDYTFGAPYCVPRVYPHLMARYLRWGRNNGVRVYNAELCPNIGEGPKAYICLKLLWNPSLDVDALLAVWYVRCVGPEAAPLLAEYYAIWERFWMEDIPRSEWFANPTCYLRMDFPEYLREVRLVDLQKSRLLLDDCVERAGTPAQQARAKLLREAFRYYKASALAYGVGAPAGAPSTEAEAVRAVGLAVRQLVAAGDRIELAQKHRDDPVLGSIIKLEEYPRLLGDAWGIESFWQVWDWARRSPRVRDLIAKLTAHNHPRVRKEAKKMLALLHTRGN